MGRGHGGLQIFGIRRQCSGWRAKALPPHILTPGRSRVNSSAFRSITIGPGAAHKIVSAAMGSKAPRKCTEDFSARIRASVGSMPKWRKKARVRSLDLLGTHHDLHVTEAQQGHRCQLHMRAFVQRPRRSRPNPSPTFSTWNVAVRGESSSTPCLPPSAAVISEPSPEREASDATCGSKIMPQDAARRVCSDQGLEQAHRIRRTACAWIVLHVGNDHWAMALMRQSPGHGFLWPQQSAGELCLCRDYRVGQGGRRRPGRRPCPRHRQRH